MATKLHKHLLMSVQRYLQLIYSPSQNIDFTLHRHIFTMKTSGVFAFHFAASLRPI